MKEDSKVAYAEVYAILNLLEKEYANRVPEKIKNFFDEERDKEYNPRIDVNVPLENQNLKRKTQVLLAILNLNYWCDSEEEKRELLKIFSKNTEIKIQEQKILEEKYNLDNILKKRQKVEQENVFTNELAITEYKEQNIIQKILGKIIRILKRK